MSPKTIANAIIKRIEGEYASTQYMSSGEQWDTLYNPITWQEVLTGILEVVTYTDYRPKKIAQMILDDWYPVDLNTSGVVINDPYDYL